MHFGEFLLQMASKCFVQRQSVLWNAGLLVCSVHFLFPSLPSSLRGVYFNSVYGVQRFYHVDHPEVLQLCKFPILSIMKDSLF